MLFVSLFVLILSDVEELNMSQYGHYSFDFVKGTEYVLNIDTDGEVFAFMESLSNKALEISIFDHQEHTMSIIERGGISFKSGMYTLLDIESNTVTGDFWLIPEGLCGKSSLFVVSPGFLTTYFEASSLDHPICVFEPNHNNDTQLEALFSGDELLTAARIITRIESNASYEILPLEANKNVKNAMETPFFIQIEAYEPADISMMLRFKGMRPGIMKQDCSLEAIDVLKEGIFHSASLQSFHSSVTCPEFNDRPFMSMVYLTAAIFLVVLLTVAFPLYLMKCLTNKETSDDVIHPGSPLEMKNGVLEDRLTSLYSPVR